MGAIYCKPTGHGGTGHGGGFNSVRYFADDKFVAETVVKLQHITGDGVGIASRGSFRGSVVDTVPGTAGELGVGGDFLICAIGS